MEPWETPIRIKYVLSEADPLTMDMQRLNLA